MVPAQVFICFCFNDQETSWDLKCIPGDDSTGLIAGLVSKSVTHLFK